MPAGSASIAIVELEDELRPDASEILGYFAENDVALKMISGDNPDTVAAIAERAGLDVLGEPVDESLEFVFPASIEINHDPVFEREDFALGDRNLGRVEAALVRTADGLVSEKLEATDATFRIVGEGSWLADEAEELGSRTSVSATLSSSDVGTTLRQLDFARGITGESMDVVFELGWGGGPRADFLAMLDGNVRIRIDDGQLEEVEPGAGRMLGLISFVALPRRLSLDFRDVFNKGFGYDKIAGTFNIEDGVAATCDLSLEGPAADIGIVGRVDLAKQQYEQAAVVSANVGNTLPLVGAVVGAIADGSVKLGDFGVARVRNFEGIERDGEGLKELKEELEQNGLRPDQADDVIESIKALEEMQAVQWDSPLDSYPVPFRAMLMLTAADCAVDWIDENLAVEEE